MLPKVPRIERRTRGKITPEYEDGGLFKSGIVHVQLALVPVFGATSRGDCCVRGFTAEGVEVMAVFAGRRRPQFQPIYSQLRSMYRQAQQVDAQRGQEMRDINSIQLPVQGEGAWRAVTERDEKGDARRIMHFLLARWGFQAQDGRTLTFGTAPQMPERDRPAARPAGAAVASNAYSAIGAGWTSALRQRSGG